MALHCSRPTSCSTEMPGPLDALALALAFAIISAASLDAASFTPRVDPLSVCKIASAQCCAQHV